MPKPSQSLAERFWSKVNKTPGCWEWTGRKDQHGRGNIKWNGTPTKAPRVAWMLTHGPIPDGGLVCHSCDNPSCVNTDHLFLGTHRANMDDMVAKGRQPQGVRNGQSKLSERDVIEIRRRCKDGHAFVSVRAAFGCSGELVSQIHKRKLWKHIPDSGYIVAA
jgi:hypothetical protein